MKTISLSQMYMLVNVSARNPATSARLKATERELAQDSGSEPDAFSAKATALYKKAPLLHKPILLVSQYREKCKLLTDPWSISDGSEVRRAGARLIHMEKIEPLLQIYAEFAAAHENALNEITPEVFEAQITLAKQAKGNRAGEVRWPTREAFLTKCVLDPPEITRLPDVDSSTGLEAVPADYLAAIDRHYSERESVMLTNAIGDRAARIYDLTTRYARQVAPGGKLHANTREALLQMTDGALPTLLGSAGWEPGAVADVRSMIKDINAFAQVDLRERRNSKEDDRKAESERLEKYGSLLQTALS